MEASFPKQTSPLGSIVQRGMRKAKFQYNNPFEEDLAYVGLLRKRTDSLELVYIQDFMHIQVENTDLKFVLLIPLGTTI